MEIVGWTGCRLTLCHRCTETFGMAVYFSDSCCNRDEWLSLYLVIYNAKIKKYFREPQKRGPGAACSSRAALWLPGQYNLKFKRYFPGMTLPAGITSYSMCPLFFLLFPSTIEDFYVVVLNMSLCVVLVVSHQRVRCWCRMSLRVWGTSPSIWTLRPIPCSFSLLMSR